jgi:hypothetical protein
MNEESGGVLRTTNAPFCLIVLKNFLKASSKISDMSEKLDACSVGRRDQKRGR